MHGSLQDARYENRRVDYGRGTAQSRDASPRIVPLISAILALIACQTGWAWENHKSITRAALQAFEGWDQAVYEPIDQVLPALAVNGKKPANLTQFTDELLVIKGDKVKWDWQPTPTTGAEGVSVPPTTLDVLVYSVREPDDGMDQNLNLSPDQKYMGGFTGDSSQGIRHMYYRSWNPLAPLVTFHFPFHEMGYAPDRAALFLDLARQAKAANHPFWAHRFLGWGLHYVQDLSQPYHSTQFASMRILPLNVLISLGWEPFVAETTRIVGNYHIAFEEYTDSMLDPERENELLFAFKVPRGDENMKIALEQAPDLKVRDGVCIVAEASSKLASEVAVAEKSLMGEELVAPGLSLSVGFRDQSGKPKIDFKVIEAKPGSKEPRKQMVDAMVHALSNTGVATRWYVDRFRAEAK